MSDFRIEFGQKYKGQLLKDIPRKDAESYIAWLEKSKASPKGLSPAQEIQLGQLKTAFAKLYANGTAPKNFDKAVEQIKNLSTGRPAAQALSNQMVHVTAKGTYLPLLKLKGKDYLEVKYRLVWFREDHPNWSISTELVAVTDKSCTAKATVSDETGRVIATSHKSETYAGFADFIEKAETGAIGRALALIGYGTQFCADELDEGERIVDSPAKPVGKKYDPYNGADKSRMPSEPPERKPHGFTGIIMSVETHYDDKVTQELLKKNNFRWDAEVKRWVHPFDEGLAERLGVQYEIIESPAGIQR